MNPMEHLPIIMNQIVVGKTINPESNQQQQYSFAQLDSDNGVEGGRPLWLVGHQRILSSSICTNSSILTRSCFMLSLSRNVTVSLSSGFSPSDSKSIVT